MAAAKKALWTRISEYQFDNLVPPHLWHQVRAHFSGSDASTRAFASKLARKLGWGRADAHRAIHEYRKFLYLGIVSEIPVTPPKIIDQVWHEHLLFSRGYREFCRAVLQHDFDHNPELVPSNTQTEIFQQQYQATLDLYNTEFGRPAPPAIWGTPKFGQIPKSKRPPESESASSGPTDTTPLWLMFDTGTGAAHHAMAEFGGSGAFSGGGGGETWGGSSQGGADASPGDDVGGGDAGGGDSGSGGDAGGSDGGGSGCSSGCGGD